MPVSFLYQVSFLFLIGSFFVLCLLFLIRKLRKELFNIRYLDISYSTVYIDSDNLASGSANNYLSDDRDKMQDIISDIESPTTSGEGDIFLKDWWSRFKNMIEDSSYKALLFSFSLDEFVLVSYTSFTVDVLGEVDKKLGDSDNLLRYLILQKKSLYFKGNIDSTSSFSVLFSAGDVGKYNHLYILPIFDNGNFLGSLLLMGMENDLSFASSIAGSFS